MQLKDEKKYDDVVDILDHYEQQLEDIYTKAGVIQKPADTEQGLQGTRLIQGLSAPPDQPGAHFNKVDDNDHMKGISVPFGVQRIYELEHTLQIICVRAISH